MIDRRKKQRFELRLSCEIVHEDSGLKTRGWAKNVSSSGVLFTSEEQVTVGASINYLLQFPRFYRARRDTQLHCTGIVLREDMNLTFAASLDRYEFVRVAREPRKEI